MTRISALTNPTALKEIARKHVSISSIQTGGKRHFSLTRLALDEYSLANDCPIILIARAGTTSIRYDAGTVASWSRNTFALDGLDVSSVLRFRVLVREPGSPRVVASAENIRLAGDGDSESLLPIEAADLGQALWMLKLDDDGPVLQCNERVFPSGASAENYQPFVALVLPEALRQVARHLASDPDLLIDESSPWKPWADWLERLGLEPRPASDDDKDKEDWVVRATEKFCNSFNFADNLHAHLSQESPS